ncbi:MAG: anhydro-N-acetylmuramic acid kinase, partial [Clostridium sp.]
MSKKYVIGLMSGTSLDAIDAALVTIEGYGQLSKVELIDFLELEIDDLLREKIKKACMSDTSTVETICSLNFELGYIFANAAKAVCRKAGITIEEVDYIGSHGQTVYHIPIQTETTIASTLQIGEPAVIAYETKSSVVSNFRVMDMAAGGQGAPLVPYTEFLLYKSDRNRCLQNIGGIGNVTVIPAGATLEDVFAFDTGPGNMIINEVVQQLKGIPYDKDGYFASIGRVDEVLLEKLMNISYIKQAPPKT